MSRNVQNSGSDEGDGADGAVWLFLLKGGAKAVAAGVTVEAEGAGVCFCRRRRPVGQDQDRRGGEFAEDLADYGFHGWDEKEFGSLLE